MHSSSWESSSRLIPTRYETDLWRTPRWELTPSFPQTPAFAHTTLLLLLLLSFSPTLVFAQTTPSPTTLPPPPPPEFSSSLVHIPSQERQQVELMNDEMGRMMENMQQRSSAPAPVQNVTDSRLTENFPMENPIQTFGDGTRKFHLQFDLRQFKPEEIQIRTTGNSLTISAKHDVNDPNKSVFREYSRSYVLPKDVSPESLTSKLSTEGVLTIEAPLPALEGPREKLILIKQN